MTYMSLVTKYNPKNVFKTFQNQMRIHGWGEMGHHRRTDRRRARRSTTVMSTEHSSISTSSTTSPLTFPLSMTSSTTCNPSSSSLTVQSNTSSTTQTSSSTTRSSSTGGMQSTTASGYPQITSTEKSTKNKQPLENVEQDEQVTEVIENTNTNTLDGDTGIDNNIRDDKAINHLDNDTATLHIGLSFTILITLAVVIIIAVASFAIIYVLRKKHRLQQQRAQQTSFPGISDINTTQFNSAGSSSQSPLENQMCHPIGPNHYRMGSQMAQCSPDPPPYDGNRAPIIFHQGQWQSPFPSTQCQGASGYDASALPEKPPLQEKPIANMKFSDEGSQEIRKNSGENSHATRSGECDGNGNIQGDDEPDYLVVVGNDQPVEPTESQIRM